MFLAYPRSDYDEPDGALASYVEVLSGYADAIVCYVTDNKTGIQRSSKFPPRIAELVEACDAAAAAVERRKRYENWGKNDPVLLDSPQSEKPSLEDLKAKYGENWGIDPTGGASVKQPVKAPTSDELAAHYRDHNLSFRPKAKGE